MAAFVKSWRRKSSRTDMSKADWNWAFLLAVAALVWLGYRLDRLGKQLEAVCAVLQVEMAELVGNENRAKEILREREEDRAEAKKANRQFWITWGVIGAVALAWWWYTVAQH
jgi:cell division protein FtsB